MKRLNPVPALLVSLLLALAVGRVLAQPVCIGCPVGSLEFRAASLDAAVTNSVAFPDRAAAPLTVSVSAGKRYQLKAFLIVADSTAASGFLFDFGGGTAPYVFWRSGCVAFSSTGSTVAINPITSTAGNGHSIPTLANVADHLVTCEGIVIPFAVGTLAMRFGKGTAGGGTATLGQGSWLSVQEIP